MKRTYAATIAGLVGIISLTGCGSQTGSEAQDPIKPSDPSYFFAQILAASQNSTVAVHIPSTLDSVIHTTTTTPDGSEYHFTDGVLVGQVSSVTPAYAIRYGSNDDDETKLDFYSDHPDARVFVVHVDTDWTAGEVPNDGNFYYGVFNGADADKFMSSAAGLGKIAVMLKKDDSGLGKGNYITDALGESIGQVAADGSLSFPGVGGDENQKAFMGDITNEAALRKSAQND